MEIALATDAPVHLDVDLLLVLIDTDPAEPVVDALADSLGEGVRRGIADFSGTRGQTLLLYPEKAQAARVVLLGMGDATDEADEAVEGLRQAAAGAGPIAAEHDAESVACVMPSVRVETERAAQAVVEGFELGLYRYQRYKSEEAAYDGPQRFVLHAGSDVDEEALMTGAQRGHILARATATARDLINRSPNEKTATLLSEAIQASGAEHGYDVEVWDKARIEEEGMGGVLAVNQGSFEPPTFSVLTWAPDEAVNEKPIILVGKGVVFDTGGLSLKPTKDSMDYMKADMGGAAAVIGAFEAIADLNLPLHVVGLIPATDNRPGNRAYVPGDVITMHSGTTVEVLNTDAEGRMLLADALSYAKRYDPELVIDLATLTGSIVVALGSDAAGVMTSETEDAAERLYAIQRAGERSGERVHPLPMYAEYAKLLDSDVADMKNVGGREAGSITAAKFLEHFTDYPWMHLDIAGTAFMKSEKPYRPKGGTGFGVRLLATFLDDYARAQHGLPRSL